MELAIAFVPLIVTDYGAMLVYGKENVVFSDLPEGPKHLYEAIVVRKTPNPNMTQRVS